MPVTNSDSGKFRIISSYAKTAPYLAEVQKSSDAHRNALGFLPKSVFEEFARRDHLYVLTNESVNGSVYVGHLLFERRFPRAHIIQTFVLQQYRRYGLATKLIDYLKTSLTHDGFTSIYARVAEDLNDANAFYNRNEFYVQRIEIGGAARGRQILVLCHELKSPQLFPVSGINAHNPLGLQITTSDVIPMYLLDLNVLFDLGPRRLRHDDVLSLFQAERANFCRLAISNEIREELLRTALQGKTDPMEAYLNIFPSFPLSKTDIATVLLKELATLIFPSKASHELGENELSDLRHVATVIEHSLAGLITSDGALLNAASRIKSRFGVEIVSPAAFRIERATSSDHNMFEAPQEATLSLLDVTSKDEAAIHTLLSRLNLSGSVIASRWLAPNSTARISMRRAVWNGEILLGYLAWPAKESAGITAARIAVDERNPHAASASRVLLVHLLEQLTQQGPRQIRLELASNQSLIRDIAIGLGFRGTPDQHFLGKLILGRVLTISTWNEYQAELANKGGLKLPTSMPVFLSADQHIRVLTPDGNQTHVKLDVLESLLSPALLCLPGRPAVITPVQKNFSELLLGHSIQTSLLPAGMSSLYHERHYLSHQRTLRLFKRGTLIFFYESAKQSGRSALVALGRVREAYLKSSEALDAIDLQRSVLTSNSLERIGKSKMKTVTVFDNIFTLPRHISLKTLKRLGCGRPNDLITTRAITDNQLQPILREAFNDG